MSETPRAMRVEPVVDGRPALTTADYADAYAVPVTGGRTAEQWVRAVFEGPPAPVRWALVFGWRVVLGLRLGPRPSADHVLGWRISESEPGVVRLDLRSPATVARLVLTSDDDQVVLTTLVEHQRGRSRVLWAALGPVHRRMVPYLLTRAATRATGR